MSPNRGLAPLRYRRLGPAEFGVLAGIELDPIQLERFVGPIAEIEAAVRRGPAHSLMAIEAGEEVVGFFVVHPEPRDAACWWLGWLALDRRQQGHGFGRDAMLAVMRQLRRVPGCRRVRLLVAADNLCARGLYEKFGFREAGRSAATQELILEAALPSEVDESNTLEDFVLFLVAARARRVFRHRRLRLTVGPHAAWVIGVERGPPASSELAGRTAAA